MAAQEQGSYTVPAWPFPKGLPGTDSRHAGTGGSLFPFASHAPPLTFIFIRFRMA